MFWKIGADLFFGKILKKCFILYDLLGTWNEWLDDVSNTVLYDRMFFCDSRFLMYLICSKMREEGKKNKKIENNHKKL